jgi:hypothetical protein
MFFHVFLGKTKSLKKVLFGSNDLGSGFLVTLKPVYDALFISFLKKKYGQIIF